MGVERRGGERLRFTGGSVIVSPAGEYRARASAAREQALAVEIDPALSRDKRITPFNHVLDDRRPEHYG